MANALQLRRGTTTQHNTFTGLAGEVTVDTDKETVVVHDGSTAGGFPLAKESDLPTASDILTSIKTVDGAASGLDADTLDGKQLATIESEYQAFANTAAANVVDSAPGTLDTLNELAAALGDDPNFATTVTNSIATKLPLAGGTLTGPLTVTASQFLVNNNDNSQTFFNYGPNTNYIRGTSTQFDSPVVHMQKVNWQDNVKGTWGSSDDLQIYHEGTHSYITNSTGYLHINSANIELKNAANNETMLLATQNGAVSLRYDNSPKFETTSTGINVTGTAVTDGVTVSGTLDIEEVLEKVQTSTSTSGGIVWWANSQAIVYYTANQTGNRTINFVGDASTTLNSFLADGQSYTASVIMAQGSTAYYLNSVQVDGTTVTPKWSGGSAPTGGNASGIDVYTFTIIKTASGVFTVLASQSQYA